MKYFIITGTSRGLGEAMAFKLISPEHHLICFSRTKNNDLIAASCHLDYYEFDLQNVNQIEALMEQVFQKINLTNAEGVYLINNAAIISPFSRIEQANSQDLMDNLHVNLLAPIVLTSSFIRFTQHLPLEKRILNISSASAKQLLPGMSAYSAAKAGLDAFSSCVGLEQGVESGAVKIVSVYPGMVDTSLQEQARNTSNEALATPDIFKMVKDRGMLASPTATADKLIGFLLGKSFHQGAVVEDLFL
ncbi:SDR family NAD(P)-dependent oxidoreductase [Paenibacillus chondroitinus]|uniref:SDR family NAD(P)-dependent oxidoreductase n=1 Tax=Paenibacillus chondroitinus TaxID=59842 RepID=A0ABU6DE76_9BACL|nr:MULTISPECIES: SDR family NAD(P)-dependent oxidoreductase [Paenibacillus]MCY9662986.1 SDR family NAD(P)-dependent oxidoreductase [Paenibacillus anseongense]MEB4795607.1 SDR family NAD(P)-dependent oxidoreductase [Paenibacillus chondroitinus]